MPPFRPFRAQGAPAWRGPAPAMLHDFHLPADGITGLDRFNAAASGVYASTPRPHFASNDNRADEEAIDAAA